MLGKLPWLGLLLGVSLALMALAFAQVRGQASGVAVGQPAPKVELPAVNVGTALPDQKDAKTLSLDVFRGKKNVVLFFFPKALTSG
jgi:cytochrome oxidase Cu insertion factor (SCO1/SenC/PrrC family)